VTPSKHFSGLRNILPDLKGLAILDSDGRRLPDTSDGCLSICYWRKYEVENYFVSPEVLLNYCKNEFKDMELFDGFLPQTTEILHQLILEQVFDGNQADFSVWREASFETARVIWESKTEQRKLSVFAEEFFRRLSRKTGGAMLLKKGELHRLIQFVRPEMISNEVRQKLDLLERLFVETRAADTTGEDLVVDGQE
jgi:hypothetical protein